jgi:hypothetical protein
LCGLCGLLTTGSHAIEAGTDAARTGAADGRERHLAWAYRIRLLNALLGPFGVAVGDWAGKYVVKGASGRTRLVDQLPQLWSAVDEVAARPVDPLDGAFIAALAAAEPVARPGRS